MAAEVKRFPKLSETFWCFRPVAQTKIDFDELKKTLESFRPKPLSPTKRFSGVLASCQACGWSSEPAGSREDLEDLLEEATSHVVYGVPKLLASCPMCFAPLTQEEV